MLFALVWPGRCRPRRNVADHFDDGVLPAGRGHRAPSDRGGTCALTASGIIRAVRRHVDENGQHLAPSLAAERRQTAPVDRRARRPTAETSFLERAEGVSVFPAPQFPCSSSSLWQAPPCAIRRTASAAQASAPSASPADRPTLLGQGPALNSERISLSRMPRITRDLRQHLLDAGDHPGTADGPNSEYDLHEVDARRDRCSRSASARSAG